VTTIATCSSQRIPGFQSKDPPVEVYFSPKVTSPVALSLLFGYGHLYLIYSIWRGDRQSLPGRRLRRKPDLSARPGASVICLLANVTVPESSLFPHFGRFASTRAFCKPSFLTARLSNLRVATTHGCQLILFPFYTLRRDAASQPRRHITSGIWPPHLALLKSKADFFSSFLSFRPRAALSSCPQTTNQPHHRRYVIATAARVHSIEMVSLSRVRGPTFPPDMCSPPCDG